ncbi:hypothetical protein D8Y20_06335 [Mariprofundus sp. EBB-1]|uniref:hypothetical protein n=1 Tax=Mariprofundus sp. EBB-1 TaxID=2650971 RepID=UPI000EF28EE2|nr:hypothetical protein [Mariprofundus sp. EBB-1]RLL52863.1 hypothetical protein D8Y20_06335 [Mariprofundus sp. EBB-1]
MRSRFIAILCCLFLLPSCLIQADNQQQADTLLKQFHQAIQSQDWNTAKTLFEPSFFATTPKDAWQKSMEDLQSSLGEILSFNISSKSKDPRFSGDFYIYIVSIQHEHGFSNETVTILKNIDNDQLSIAGHQFKIRSKQ